MVESRLRVIDGRGVPELPVTQDPWELKVLCADTFVASWRSRGFSSVTIDNDLGLLERTLKALGRPAWDVTPEDIDRVVGDLAVAGRAASTRREHVQIFKGFHRFLQARKAAEIEVAFGVRLVCPVDEFNASRHVADDSPALQPSPPAPRPRPPISATSSIPAAPRRGCSAALARWTWSTPWTPNSSPPRSA